MTNPNPMVDLVNAIKVPSAWPLSQGLVDLIKKHAEQGTQIVEPAEMDVLLGLIVGSQMEVISAAGAREAQAAELKESFRKVSELFKKKGS
ncbi:Uncharacterised protein [Mycobacteroides abscessus subsp. abscessus]|uniref:hypothetical protein n=1 Tax=Mycobacteroides abscessus TaxID=36809 RepID=UPI00092BAAFC|nr:hypothetical protein [Mycobacteroides abscessus]SIH89882.1 Uncharacterised protein [Mycobacteroides abscessus subsp. abscessus]SIJ11704.1 Uncharacterised protein [Mycobacteroides abscessus subsp. abscessus]SIJ48203.1 Uncharacterised protein [Mycobacteroides abscessus subsp. abscessus]